MGNYTIKGLAKANECNSLDEAGLARIWDYWLVCNCCDRQSVKDFKSLRKSEQKKMLEYLKWNYEELYQFILNNII